MLCPSSPIFAPLRLGARSLLCLFFSLAAPAEARLHFETTAVKDTVEPGAGHYAFSFPFENQGDQAVEIKEIRTSCGCTVAQLEQRVYQPGESGEIKGQFNIGNRQGRQVNTVRVQSDNLGQSEIVLQVEVTIPQLLSMKPGLLLWRTGETPEPKFLTLTPNTELGVKILSVDCDSDDFSVKWIPQAGEDPSYEVVVAPATVAEARRAMIRIKAALPDHPEPHVFFAHAMVR